MSSLSGAGLAPKEERYFETKHFDQLLTNPFGAIVGEYSREGWFIYFYQEAKSHRQNRDGVLDVMNALFVCPDNVMQGAAKYEMRSPYRSLDDVPDSELCSLMEDFLRMGFERIPLRTQRGRISDCSYDVAQAKIYYDVNEHVAAAWRSETRNWETLKLHNGCLCQANFEARAKELNMREEWHPFNRVQNRQYLWYRKGQNDNCKYTVVSLGNHFRVAANFPKLEDRASWPGMPHQVDMELFSTLRQAGEVEVTGKKISGKYIADVKLSCAKGIVNQLMIVTRVYVAIVFRQGWIVNTHLKQVKSKGTVEMDEALKLGKTPGFREIGAGDIPFKYYFGAIAILRVHHGSDDNDGYTVLIDKPNCFHKSEQDLLEIFVDEQKAGDAHKKMMALFTEWKNALPFTNRWQGEGGFDDGPQLQYLDSTWNRKMPASVMEVKCADGTTWRP